MTAIASKPEEKRLGWSVQTGADQTKSHAKPAAEAKIHPKGRYEC